MAAAVKGIFKLAVYATPIAIGAIAATVPIEVPIAVEIKQDIKNTPGTKNTLGIKVNPRFTTDSTPPIALAAPWNPPAKRYIKPIKITPGFPAFSEKISIFFQVSFLYS